jgi:hypothetical protein
LGDSVQEYTDIIVHLLVKIVAIDAEFSSQTLMSITILGGVTSVAFAEISSAYRLQYKLQV